MKKTILQFSLVLIFTNLFFVCKSQTPPDRWDTLYNTTAVSPPNYFEQSNLVVRNSKLFLSGDTINSFNSSLRNSYLAVFNPTTSIFSPINYTRPADDYGFKGEATITTSTPNISYTFLGGKLNNSVLTNSFSVFKLNTSNNAVSYEQMAYPTLDFHDGVENMCFFSPLSNHDSLLVFVDSAYMKTSIFKKHYNQVGFSNTNNLSIPLNYISLSFVFNNVLYVSGTDVSTSYGALFASTNGVTFNEVTSYTTNVGSFRMVAADTLNNELYFAIEDGDGSYAIYKTPNGTTFTQLIPLTIGKVTSLKKHRKSIWYSVTSTNRPTVRYLAGTSFTTEINSVTDIGKEHSDPNTFRLNKLNSELIYTGNYISNFQTPHEFGTFIYKFIPPVASFTLANQLCLNTSYTVVSTSLNSDSVRWIKDNNYYASTANSFTFQFTTAGTHTLGLIAISGTQKDTLKMLPNVYSVSSTINAPPTACQNTPFQITSTNVNAIGTITYSWTQTPIFSSGTYSTQNILVGVTNPGVYNYFLQIKDINNCVANSNTVSLSVFSSKNISGAVTTATALPVIGDVVLYKYEPVLTKFDSVTYVSTNVSGDYTFTTIDSGTYIIKCIPSASSLQITYGNSAISWQNAFVLTHGCINSSSQNINVIPLTNLGTGPGILSGVITEGIGYGQKGFSSLVPGAPIKGVSVKGGRNPGGDITAQSRTNAAGQYTLSGFPVNQPNEDYFVLVDIPGLDTNTTYHRVITLSNSQFTNLDFVVDSAKVNPINNFVGVKEITFDKNKVKLFPNPTNGYINIEFELGRPTSVKVEVCDVFGRIVKTILPSTYQNENEIKLNANLNDITSGVYFIKISIGESERTSKIILTK
ncbi:MAG: T9SS type A sorting domain-containing protein [Bacteroidota bacterium]|nr:T9SS type A sorting domain-containing protein [Bacteroidota bacterium]